MQFEQLGPYRLGKKLGQGGMGAVYEGIESLSNHAAAIKVLSPTLAADEGFRVRFEAEIESLKKLRHPNIVRLFGYGEQSGTLFYAMELVPGTSLEDELRRGRRFEWREVTQIGIKLCKALKHAHDHGVIHRDLKPANLLLTAEGEIKLSDFGIARLFGNTRMTSDGGVLGTAEYMAPEQAEGKTVTDRCDQYSLGGVLYALLAGRPPFRARSLVEMLQLQRFAEPEPVTRYAPDTPPELASIIHQLLEKDPQKRFANTLILARSLEAMEKGLSISLSRHHEDFVVIEPEEPDAGLSGYDPQSPTLSPTQLQNVGRRPTRTPSVDATEATMAFAVHAERAKAAEADATPPALPATRFTKVHEKNEEPSALAELLAGLFAPQTLALLLGLALLVGGGWYLMRPQSADALFHQIEAATADGDPAGLKSAQSDIETFLSRYPDDARADQVRALEEETKQSSPVARAYAEAKRTALNNPELALARFEAIIDLYGGDESGAEVSKKYITMAQQQKKRLQNRIDRYVESSREVLTARLAKAAELAPKQPDEARKIYHGVVELYRDKPWAADLVRRASEAQKALPPAKPAAK